LVVELVVEVRPLLLDVVGVRPVDKAVVETKLLEDVVGTRLPEEDGVGVKEVAGQLETLAVTVRGTPSTFDVPVWVMVVVEISVTTSVEDK